MQSESTGGLVLIAAAVLALLVANSALAPAYFGTLETEFGGLTVVEWINDAFMAFFFLLIGLEVKREFLDGELSSWPRRILPGVAAAGGMIVPALIFVALNARDPLSLRGWAIPTATDIAFALGVLALLGSRVPASLKVFLTALAIIDDLGAVVIIAAVYTADLAIMWLAGAAAVLAILWTLNRAGVTRLSLYLILGAVLWYLVLRSGVHPTLAGVGLAAAIPTHRSAGRAHGSRSPLQVLEHALQPWVAYLVLPLFAFSNAGLSFAGLGWSGPAAHVSAGIAAGLFLGKQLGVFGFAWTTIRLGFADCPRDASMPQIYGVSLLCGIGFTMSLFIGLLAFPDAAQLEGGVKLGVLAGSLCSAVLGTAVLALANPRRRRGARASE